jgi:hypothetical protein
LELVSIVVCESDVRLAVRGAMKSTAV